MLKNQLALMVLIPFIFCDSFALEKRSSYLIKNKNVGKEIVKVRKEQKNTKKNLEKIFNKNIEKYFVNDFDFKEHFITELFKVKYAELKYNESVLSDLMSLKEENLKKARKKINLSDDILAYMNISVLDYIDNIERISSFKHKFIKENNLEEIDCGFIKQKIYRCYQWFVTDEKEMDIEDVKSDTSLSLQEEIKSKSVYFKEVTEGVLMSINDISPKSGSNKEIAKVGLLRMSFFMNGVILDQGDL